LTIAIGANGNSNRSKNNFLPALHDMSVEN
jgi:hypothetical protein